MTSTPAPVHQVPPPGPASAPFVAELRDVSKRFGSTQALSDVTIRVRQGETHALLGRNGAGKSTAVSVLTGLQRADDGDVLFGGEPAPRDVAAWRDHVACLYQHSTLIPAMTVAENLFIDRFSSRGSRRTVSRRGMRREALGLLSAWEIDVDPGKAIEDLSFEQRQLVEIARALSQGSEFIILDEPTAQLDSKQIQRLFASIRRIQDRGISFLYISHFLREVFEICDTATVMRDGRCILTEPVSAVDEDDLVRAMVGGETVVRQERRTPVADPADEPMVVLEGFSGGAEFAPVELSIRPGEVLGIAGSVRSGATALGEMLAGLRPPVAGRVLIDGRELPQGRVDRAIRGGVGYVPQDRRERGFVGSLSVAENLTMTIAAELGGGGVVLPSRRADVARTLIERYAIKVAHAGDLVEGLSGGNQQKVVVARAVASRPRLLVLDTPTAGVDIASVATLFAAIDDIARQGVAVLVISNTISELRLCDSVQVMFAGRLTQEFAAGWDESAMIAAIEGVQRP